MKSTKQVNKQLRSMYKNDKLVRGFIDLLAYCFLNITRKKCKKIHPDTLEHLIREFLLIGRVTFNKDTMNRIDCGIFDPDNVRITPIPGSTKIKLDLMGVDKVFAQYSDNERANPIILIRHANKYDKIGTSVINPNYKKDGSELPLLPFNPKCVELALRETGLWKTGCY